MPETGRQTIVVWAVAAVIAVIAAVRILGGGEGSAAPPVRIDGAGGGRSAGAGARGAGRAGDGAGPGSPTAGVYVHVAGAVRHPGLLRLPEGARIAVAIERAGGFARRADTAAVNLAARVEDGQQVLVPRVGAAGALVAGPDMPGAPAPGTPGVAKVSLSSATPEQLDAIDGIGPTLAGRIIEYRDQHGGFRSVGELREVEGIGDKRFESLHDAVQP